MKVFFYLILVINFLHSSVDFDLLSSYRENGLKGLKAKLEVALENKSYWSEVINNRDVTYGYYESLEYIILCNKNEKNVHIFDTNDTKSDPIASYDVLIGKNSGDKLQEGDKVTPIGAYKLSSKLTRLDQFYGPLALVTDYPNKLDRILGKTGHGIWLHGMPLDEKRENNYTKGCIAFDNTQLVELDKKIDIKKTILLIYENDLFKVTNENIVTILSQLYKWKHAWEKNDMAEYMTFYDKDFIKYNGQKLRKFKQYKQSIFSRKQYKEITFKNINIIPYPNIIGQKVFKVFIHEEYYSRSYKFKGDKELYLEVIDGKISILAES